MLLLTDSPVRTLVVIELGGGGGDVTECIWTLCLCCCMYSVCLSVGVLSCVYVSQSFTYALRVVIYTSLWDVTISESERRWEGRTTTSLVCTIQKKRRNKIRNLWLWLVCCSLLPTCNFHHHLHTKEKYEDKQVNRVLQRSRNNDG